MLWPGAVKPPGLPIQLPERCVHSVSRRSESVMQRTTTDLSAEAISAVMGAVNPLLADAFALYLKTKNFHWHLGGPDFRDYHLLLDEQGEQIFCDVRSNPGHKLAE